MWTIGLLHFVIRCILIAFVGKHAVLPFLQTGIYLMVPYLLTAVAGLAAVRKVHGKEAVYLCTGMTIMISFSNIIIQDVVPGVYEDQHFMWWCAMGGI